ncbi:MAG: sialate O-acetylesterase [Flavobacteriaceae bacterium]
MLKRILFIAIIFQLFSCGNKDLEVLNLENSKDLKFYYFSNGYLSQSKYAFKTVSKDGRTAGEIIRAKDASVWTGVATELINPIEIKNGKKFTIDVFMDHIGSFSFKLEKSQDGGSDTNISVKNTRINEWETLVFDFKDAIFNAPTYPKIALFADLNKKSTGKDEVTYFSNIRQIPNDYKEVISGNKKDAIKIVVIGSSTAAGTGPTDSKNAWVNRYRRKVVEKNGYNEVINLAVGGYTTYQLVPSDAVIPNGRPKSEPEHNVTKAISFKPDAVLINLPSNDANLEFSIKEQLDNYTKMTNALDKAGIKYWISTTQGRNFSKEKRKAQQIMKDSTDTRYGRNTLDFWKGFANWNGTIKEKYDSGDGVHMNDLAHKYLFEEVWDKDVLGTILDARAGIKRKDSAYTSPKEYKNYHLVWEDDFNGDKLNKKSWTHELGNGCPRLCGWGNNEKVWYRPENSVIDNGILTMNVKKDKEQEGYWSSSRIITSNKVNFKMGRIDVRAKLPETRGLWPAIWLLGQNRAEIGWPKCGELDIMEEVGHMPFRVRGTTIFPDSKKKTQFIGEKFELQHSKFSDDFHVFSIVWDEKGIQYLVDNKTYYNKTYVELGVPKNDNPFLKPMFLILNCAVGGNLPKNPDYTSVFPQTFEIDYVRYFQENRVEHYPKVVEKVKKMPKKDKVWVYLMAGQSNMEGNGQVMPQDTIPHNRLITINPKGEWVKLKEPINLNFSWYKKLDCVNSFGNNLLKKVPKDVTVAMIPAAVGGSSVDHWLNDNEFRTMHLWSNMTEMIAEAKKVGTIKGMIWHQGETDAKKDKLAAYPDKLTTLFNKIRKECDNPNMPIVIGELGDFGVDRPVWKEFNQLIEKYSKDNNNIEIIKTTDLDHMGDKVHFNNVALRTMGKRYAEKMRVE